MAAGRCGDEMGFLPQRMQSDAIPGNYKQGGTGGSSAIRRLFTLEVAIFISIKNSMHESMC